MSLNEECLLNYLKKPDELAYITEFLKLNNKILENEFITEPFFNKINLSMLLDEV